jgi:hypothetical protein
MMIVTRQLYYYRQRSESFFGDTITSFESQIDNLVLIAQEFEVVGTDQRVQRELRNFIKGKQSYLTDMRIVELLQQKVRISAAAKLAVRPRILGRLMKRKIAANIT